MPAIHLLLRPLPGKLGMMVVPNAAHKILPQQMSAGAVRAEL